MSEQRIKALLLHIQEDLRDIQQYICGVPKEEFIDNSMMKKAVCMSLLNIGEAAHNLPDSFFERNPSIPWKSIIGLRNRTAHGYHSLDDEIVWDIAKNDLDELSIIINKELEN